MGSGFSKLKKQAKQFEAQYEKMQDTKRKLRVQGSAGNGLVSLELNGDKELQSIKIQPECVTDLEALEELIVAAYQDGVKKITDQGSHDFGGIGLS